MLSKRGYLTGIVRKSDIARKRGNVRKTGEVALLPSMLGLVLAVMSAEVMRRTTKKRAQSLRTGRVICIGMPHLSETK